MTTAGWRAIAIILAVICVVQLVRGTRSPVAAVTAASSDCRATGVAPTSSASHAADRASASSTDESTPTKTTRTTRSLYGFKLPAWAMLLTPQPGENLRDYRDRILPIAERAIAPQRARVTRARDELTMLDPHQRAELDAAVEDAASAIRDRVMNGIMTGELRPATFKPMTGIAVARDVLDIIDRGNTRFVNALTPDQRSQLASHRFDFADYLMFSTRWEDALHTQN